MNKNFSNNIPSNLKSTVTCPRCGTQNTVRKDKLLYFHDTMCIKGICCDNCEHLIPSSWFTQKSNDSIMHG